MDVYHKVLVKIYEMTGGRDKVDVDLTELTKREGFFPSIDDITANLSGESWVTETSRRYVVRITHWGIAEAKKALSSAPDNGHAIAKEANRLVSFSREFLVMLEEFAGSPSADKLDPIEKRLSEITSMLEKIKGKV